MTESGRYAGRTVLVTGASGIVGSWLVRSLLGAGATVVALVRDDDPHSEFVRSGDVTRVARVHGSLEDLVLLERTLVQYEVHVVFHLGAQTQVRHAQWSPWASLEANVRGTYNLLEACRRNTRTLEALVIASSDKAYGETRRPALHGGAPPGGTQHLRCLEERRRPPGVGIRAQLRAAARHRPLRATSTAAATSTGIASCRGRSGRSCEPRHRSIRSDGTLLRDYLHVDDAVGAYLVLGAALLEGREHAEAFNFGHGDPGVGPRDRERDQVRGRDPDIEPLIQANAPNEIQAQWLDSDEGSRATRLAAFAEPSRWHRRDGPLVPGPARVSARGRGDS